MSTTTYPDGSKLTSTALTPDRIQTAFQVVTANMLGIITDPVAVNITLVIGQFVLAVDSTLLLYQGQLIVAVGIPVNTFISGVDTVAKTVTLSNKVTANGVQPATVTDPKAYFKVRIDWQEDGQPGPPIEEDTVSLRCVTINTEYGRMRDVTGAVLDDTITQTDVYTRAWKVFWTFYGVNSLDQARAVMSALITIQFVADYLEDFNLFVNPDIEIPARFRENFQGRWWERTDLTAEFNEQVTETFTVGIVKSVEVKGFTKDGQFTDLTVTTP